MIIDFDKQFRLYLASWLERNAEKFESPEEMENSALDVYSAWLTEPADWLNNLCPEKYFAQFENPDELVDMLVEYLNSNVGIPDLLLDEISKQGSNAKDALVKLFNLKYNIDEDNKSESLMLAINLLAEIDDEFMHDNYVDLLLDANTYEEVANLIVERIKYAGKDVADRIIAGLEKVNDEEIETRCMDVLVNFPGDDRIYSKLISMFNEYTNTSLLAAYLGKYGDERATNILEEALDWEGINYLDYIEIKNSIEELGKEVTHVRSFDGDEYYESLKNIEQEV